MLPILFIILRKKIPIKIAATMEVKRTVVLIFSAVALLFGLLYYNNILYVIDIGAKNTITTEIKVPELKEDNRGLYITDANKKRISFYDEQNKELIEQEFGGHRCKVEYFKLSRIAAKIAIAD
jgi:hypothetical protein